MLHGDFLPLEASRRVYKTKDANVVAWEACKQPIEDFVQYVEDTWLPRTITQFFGWYKIKDQGELSDEPERVRRVDIQNPIFNPASTPCPISMMFMLKFLLGYSK